MIPLLERNHLHGLADRRGEEAANLDPQLLEPLGHVVDEALHKEGGLFPRASGMDARALLPDPFFLIP